MNDPGDERTKRRSLFRRIRLAFLLGVVLAAAAAAWAAELAPSRVWYLVAAAAGAAAIGWWVLERAALAPFRHGLEDLADGVRSFRDGDFTVRLAIAGGDEVGSLARLYNEIADVLQDERSTIFQKELLLETVLQASPMGTLLVGERERIVLANRAAARLLALGAGSEGRRLGAALEGCREELAEAVLGGEDRLLTFEVGEGAETRQETYLVVHRAFTLYEHRLGLIMVSRLSPELQRQEVEVWKRVIRTMSHELNNSLAPIASLARSAQAILEDPGESHRLESILEVIRERADHLRDFLEGYARFARLPRPRREAVAWEAFLAEVAAATSFRLVGRLPAHPGRFDPSQLQQVLINVLQNAHECGSPPEEITVEVECGPGFGTRIEVCDRGPGISDEALEKALVPLFSEKPRGAGIGLALCREIVDAHHGRLELARREGGGVRVVCWIPE
jgi:nitrogen fixation/metabolism regulation signal transduction histidine kinase